jgi:hypothetical protein
MNAMQYLCRVARRRVTGRVLLLLSVIVSSGSGFSRVRSAAGAPSGTAARLPATRPAASIAAGYTIALTTPQPPAGAKTFVRRISGSKPGPEQEVSNAIFSGCWKAGHVVSATASVTGSTPPVTIDPSSGSIKVDNLSDKMLPVTRAVTYGATWASATSGTNVALKMGSKTNTSTAAGPCAG